MRDYWKHTPSRMICKAVAVYLPAIALIAVAVYVLLVWFLPRILDAQTHVDGALTSLSLTHVWVWASALQPHTHTLTRPHTLTITCTCCYDEIKGTQDQDFSCSVSDSLSPPLSLTHTLTHTLTIPCTCCHNVIHGIQDLTIYSHADSLILSRYWPLTSRSPCWCSSREIAWCVFLCLYVWPVATLLTFRGVT